MSDDILLDEKVTISCKISIRDLKRIKKYIPYRYKTKSSAVAHLAMIGVDALDFKEMLKDPTKAHEFTAKMNERIQKNEIEHHAATLTTTQLEGFIGMYSLELEGRHEQKRFR